ncbi:MAG: hypothetical protein H0U77_09095 [Nocardioidaceae bacterium]|nr:hypothetical protein [Nocardioidaceae bacterium]
MQESASLPEWTSRYDDVLDLDQRGVLAVWRAARGLKPDDRSLTGPAPDDDREAAYHRHLNRTINARYGDALQVWETKILDYTRKRDDHTATLARQLDGLARRGHDADRLLDLAAARKPLPVDHPTSALAYRVKELVTPKKRKPQTIDPFPRSPQPHSGPTLGM